MVLAKLLQAPAIAATDRVLDVGCATGYGAAVLAQLAGEGGGARGRAALAGGQPGFGGPNM